MAGYLINLDSEKSLEDCIAHGVYSTRLGNIKKHWSAPQEGTLADYLTMRPGDNIYFFFKRKIYGIGELVQTGIDCKYKNFPRANLPTQLDYSKDGHRLLHDYGRTSNSQRWICTFQPAPFFFREGIDMDDLLTSDSANFRMLRAFWKLSFIKFDDNENQAFKNAILKKHKDIIGGKGRTIDYFQGRHEPTHKHIAKAAGPDYLLDVADVLTICADGDGLKHEMALEAGLLNQLANPLKYRETKKVFGEWDYLSHQVIASPFKPIDYMDKMDVFGYSYIRSYKPTKDCYLIAELKRGAATEDDVSQLMKYVDWVREEYAHSDYSMVKAFLVAHEIGKKVVEHAHNIGQRMFTLGKRPAKTSKWDSLTLVQYSYNARKRSLIFSPLP